MIKIAFVLLPGCASQPSNELIVHRDEGRLCLFSKPGGLERIYSVDEPVFVVYTLDNICLSSSCTSKRNASCSVTEIGHDFTVTSNAEWVETPHDKCLTDCLVLNAECTTDPLAAGSYTFHYADHTLTLDVPSSAATDLCF